MLVATERIFLRPTPSSPTQNSYTRCVLVTWPRASRHRLRRRGCFRLGYCAQTTPSHFLLTLLFFSFSFIVVRSFRLLRVYVCGCNGILRCVSITYIISGCFNFICMYFII